jgi:hypothetical protein
VIAFLVCVAWVEFVALILQGLGARKRHVQLREESERWMESAIREREKRLELERRYLLFYYVQGSAPDIDRIRVKKRGE